MKASTLLATEGQAVPAPAPVLPLMVDIEKASAAELETAVRPATQLIGVALYFTRVFFNLGANFTARAMPQMKPASLINHWVRNPVWIKFVRCLRRNPIRD